MKNLTDCMKWHGGNMQKKLTDLQLECYERNMNCLGCFYSRFNKSEKCRIKKSIIEFILKYGKPENLTEKGFKND